MIDVERAPVAGVKVRYFDPGHGSQDGIETETDADGAFTLEDPHSGGHLDIASPGWTSVFRPEFSEPPELGESVVREFVLVVARSIVLGGIVVDEQRRGIEAADLKVPLPFALRSRFDAILDSSSTVERSAKTGADGRFELADVPLVSGAQLVATHAAYVADERALPAYDHLALEIVLRPARAEPRRLSGQVLDPDENPVEGAWVALGSTSTRSGPAGVFTLDLGPRDDPLDRRFDELDTSPLRAVKPGYLPAEIARPPGDAWPMPLILRLGGQPLAIAGRVVDVDGRPISGAEVWTDEETLFGFVEIEGGEMSMQALAKIEGILRGDPWTRHTRTDSGGRFDLAGLLPRDYRVHALDKQHLLATTARFPAGLRDVEIRMPREDLFDRVAGRVATLSGEPLAGVEVLLERALAGVQGVEIEGYESLAALTDAEGLFAFEDVSRAVNRVKVRGLDLGLIGFERSLGPDDDVENLELAVPLRVHL
ncbi:MAG: carboxypeptidase-like regulatory domain-containing protein, partial [Chloroflexi bacterium]|nr:carboxypeptidase-like regulatory domain-containing protein [Chloroflexota bacterium]